MTHPGRLVGGRYRLLERIGSGAMGVVWRARDERLGRVVAVKQLVLTPAVGELDAGRAAERAMREGRLAARLHHPNAIAVFDVADHDGTPWLVMEYLESLSLATVLAERGPRPPRDVAAIGRQIASALAAAHAVGIVHRDVKPGNVLLGRGGVAKLTDFGISRAADDVTVTRTGVLTGTPAYLAPEVARGAQPAAESDVFALGATLYASVEGVPPFGAGDNAIALLHQVARGHVTPPRQAGSLTAVLMRLLRVNPAERPTMAQAAVALTDVADGKVASLPSRAPSTTGAATGVIGRAGAGSAAGDGANTSRGGAPPGPGAGMSTGAHGHRTGAALLTGAPATGAGHVGAGLGAAPAGVPLGAPSSSALRAGATTGGAAPGTARPPLSALPASGHRAGPAATHVGMPLLAEPPPGPGHDDGHGRGVGHGRGHGLGHGVGHGRGHDLGHGHDDGRRPNGLSRRVPLLIAAGVALAVIAGLLVAAAVSRPDRPSRSAPPSATTTAQVLTPTTTAPPTPTTTPPPTTTRPPASTAELQRVVTSYYELLPDDTEKAWARLSPTLQARIGGYDRYRRLWREVESVQGVPGAVNADAGTVEVLVVYRTDDGRQAETRELTIIRGGDGYLIDGDESLGRAEAPTTTRRRRG